VELHGFMVANYAEINRGLLYVQGGGWEFGTASESPPTLLPIFVAGHIYSEPGTAPDDVALEISLEIPDGTQVAVASALIGLRRSHPVDGEIQIDPVAVGVPLPISEGGQHAVLLTAGGASDRVPVFIRVPPAT
jgi:hypothetical protein